MNEVKPMTTGAHHVGLTVSRLEASAEFFTNVLGWSEVRRDSSYSAIFVTDGVLMVTLWEAKTDAPNEFDRREDIGLHHLALSVDSFERLDAVHENIKEHGIKVEFAPELLRDGPAKHMMCYEPSGIRVEFICIPK